MLRCPARTYDAACPKAKPSQSPPASPPLLLAPLCLRCDVNLHPESLLDVLLFLTLRPRHSFTGQPHTRRLNSSRSDSETKTRVQAVYLRGDHREHEWSWGRGGVRQKRERNPELPEQASCYCRKLELNPVAKLGCSAENAPFITLLRTLGSWGIYTPTPYSHRLKAAPQQFRPVRSTGKVGSGGQRKPLGKERQMPYLRL